MLGSESKDVTTIRRSTTGAVAGGLSLGAIFLVGSSVLSFLWWRRRRNKQVFFDVNGNGHKPPITPEAC